MNDTFYELLIPRKNQKVDTITRILIVAAITIFLIASLFLGPLPLILAIILGIVAYFFIFPRCNVEYEYSLLNHDIQVDIIYNKVKRKKVIAFDLQQAEIIALHNSPRLASYKNMKLMDCSAGDPNQIPYAVILSQDKAKNCVLLQLDDRMITQFSSFMPRTFFKD